MNKIVLTIDEKQNEFNDWESLYQFVKSLRAKYFFTKELKEKIRKRDNNQCRFCGVKNIHGNEMAVHHLDDNENNNNENNLVTLCAKCHANVHMSHKKTQDRARKMLF